MPSATVSQQMPVPSAEVFELLHDYAILHVCLFHRLVKLTSFFQILHGGEHAPPSRGEGHNCHLTDSSRCPRDQN